MRVGDVVGGRFEIDAFVGSGGMGDVHLARDRTTGERVALKSLAAHGGSAERFLREAELLAELQHPAIVRHVAHGTSEDGALYIAMEWLEGEDLSQRLQRAPLTIAESVALITRIAEALAVVHARGIVHRDLKPGNIFLPASAVDDVKILDFGIAHISGAALTATGSTIGTPGYMAPEQARGAPDVDARADVFSLGCVLFECVSGQPAYAGGNGVAILAKVLFEEPPRLSVVRPDVSPALDALVARMLAKPPIDRPAGGAALLQELWELGTVSGAAPKPSVHPPALTGGEQRFLTVVMARDVAARTALPTAMAMSEADTQLATSTTDPLARVAALALSYNARIEQVRDGTLVAVFASRGSATDQAASAARFALELQVELRNARVIVATGRGLVAQRLPIGDAIERGAALLREATNARAGDVTIDQTTAALVEGRFDLVHDDGRITLVRERARTASGGRELLGKSTPCVGRDRELSMLDAIVAESTQESVARAILVTGPAGAGKSRVLSEFLHRLRALDEQPQRWFGWADTMHAGSPFGLLAPLLRAEMGVREGDAPNEQRARVLARVARHVDAGAQSRVAEFLGEMIGVRFPEEPGSPLQAARRDAVLLSDQMLRAFEDFVGAEVAAGPLLITLEDIHWGDAPSLAFLDRVLRNLENHPLIVLATARPEVRDAFPKLWAERVLTEMRLPGLSRKAAERLVRSALGESLNRARVAAIADRADGNAFYLEELIRAESEGRHDLPETVVAMVQIRLGALSDDTRRVVRAASVFGESFWDGSVSALVGHRVRDAGALLHELVEREVIEPVAQSRCPGHHEYRFRHAIVREAAYGMLTDADRTLGHTLAAEWLERNGQRDALVLANHHRRGGALDRAITCYVGAADQALDANDFAGAISSANEGLACGAAARERGELLRVQADAHRWSGRVVEALACATEAMDLLDVGSVEWCKAAEACGSASMAGGHADAEARTNRLVDVLLDITPTPGAEVFLCGAMSTLARSMYLHSRFDAGDRLFARIEPLVQSFGAEERASRAYFAHLRAVRARMVGDLGRSVELNEVALAEYQALSALRQTLFISNNLADCLLQIGAFERAIDLIRSTLPIAEKMALDRETSLGKLNLGFALGAVGETAAALTCIDESMRLYAACGNWQYRAFGLEFKAHILCGDGRLDDAAAAAVEAIEALQPFPHGLPQALGILAEIELKRGRVDEALRLSSDAAKRLEALGSVMEGAELIRLTHARALYAAGDVDGAKTAISKARERVLQNAALIGDAAHRESFLSKVRVHAETLRLAEEWLA